MKKGTVFTLFLLSLVLVLTLFLYDDVEGRDEFCRSLASLFRYTVKALGYFFDIAVAIGKALMQIAARVEGTPTPAPTPSPGTPPAVTPTPVPTPPPTPISSCETLSPREVMKCAMGVGVLIMFYSCLLGLSSILSTIGNILK